MSNWIKKYRKSAELVEESTDVLTGFNANIDVSHKVSELDLDLEEEPELKQRIGSMKDLIASIAYCVENGENNEVDLGNFEIELEGEETLGGQAGIMSNFLAETSNGVIFYTPLLSEELAQMLDEKVLYPVMDGSFKLKNVRDSSTTDRTKRNHIFEFQGEKTGRLIVSDPLKGFGPYFRKGVMDNIEIIKENIDCAILSGFHDVEGNTHAKLEKSRQQIEEIKKPVHIEYVHKNKLAEQVEQKVIPVGDSLGLDETELKKLYGTAFEGELEEKVNMGEAFNAAKKMIQKYDLSRIHIHTYRYHLTVTRSDYPVEKEKIREAMLYGELAALKMAETGELPDREDIKQFDMENKELQSLEELRNFQGFFQLEDFSQTGTAEIEEFKVVAIPTIIHEDPERTVGMGDVISAGAFAAEHS